MCEKKYPIIEIIKNAICFLFFPLLILLIVLFFNKTIVQVDKDISKALIYLVSDNLVSSIIGAIIGAITGGLFALGIAIISNNRQERHSEAQLTKQEEHAEQLLIRQFKLSEEHFKKQQLLELKKGELNYYLDNLNQAEILLVELDELINNKLTPLTIQMINLEDDLKYNHDSRLFDSLYENSKIRIHSYYDSFTRDYQRLREINIQLMGMSSFFDTDILGYFDILLKEHPTKDNSGLENFVTYINKIWMPINDQHFFDVYQKYNFDLVEYEIIATDVKNNILKLTTDIIPLKRKKKFEEIKSLFK
ncbi:hypothetical protein [Streptococcus parauberis]|uniref:hypothetical protein n=1 Tax=Streptococcus parauberis TaxID=1348 RepID=UPI0002B9FB15|nr:hypothetical protein [Streptococcus parauberis]QBX09914.1 hypothetical protein JavanS397_0016 [Streptococcus satellite phage Javan397]EMF48565.1 hypothetical protein SPJ2_1778 [Streptococcus parauberis KRS-02109]UWM86759.1 hypothetical protein N2A93_09195 [Streptococcus parauberis]UWM88731.1 hypothetical protein N2A96_09195 [Streptococcus parauberis]WEM59512.1 hypothetical protein P1T47_08960 [Streptococcus parauberis]